jgi:hypothetical protein
VDEYQALRVFEVLTLEDLQIFLIRFDGMSAREFYKLWNQTFGRMLYQAPSGRHYANRCFPQNAACGFPKFLEDLKNRSLQTDPPDAGHLSTSPRNRPRGFVSRLILCSPDKPQTELRRKCVIGIKTGAQRRRNERLYKSRKTSHQWVCGGMRRNVDQF